MSTPTDPKFTEMQAVRVLLPKEPIQRIDGIIVACCWEEAGTHWRTGEPYEARWIYKIQVGDSMTDVYFTDDHLEAR